MNMIIGISGVAGSGKDTVAEYLVKNHNFARVGLADEIKRICQSVFNFTDVQLWGPSSMRNAPDKRYPRKHTYGGETTPNYVCVCCGWDSLEDGVTQCYLTPRFALQRLGTEWGRLCCDGIWMDGALLTAKQLLNQRLSYSAKTGLHSWDVTCNSQSEDAWTLCYRDPQGVVFSDIRFKNEMADVKEAGGRLVRVKRGDGLGGASAQHSSEAEQLEVPDSYFDHVIDNSDITLEELEQRVSSMYKQLC